MSVCESGYSQTRGSPRCWRGRRDAGPLKHCDNFLVKEACTCRRPGPTPRTPGHGSQRGDSRRVHTKPCTLVLSCFISKSLKWGKARVSAGTGMVKPTVSQQSITAPSRDALIPMTTWMDLWGILLSEKKPASEGPVAHGSVRATSLKRQRVRDGDWLRGGWGLGMTGGGGDLEGAHWQGLLQVEQASCIWVVGEASQSRSCRGGARRTQMHSARGLVGAVPSPIVT